MGRTLSLPTARVFAPLLEPARDKGVWGGRGGGKSHFFAGLACEDALAHPGENGGEGLRMVCIREIQKDLAQSAKALVESKINAMGLTEADGFKIFREAIQLPNDGLMIFKGMNDYTADSVKSLEGFHRSWWEEAQTATARSIQLLRPTMRATGSQLWWSWNPRRKQDPIELMLRGDRIPTGAKVIRALWRDNPWFGPELEQERLDSFNMEPEQYPHVWEGEYVSIVSGAYYAAHIATARKENRIGNVAPDPLMTYRAVWDIGGTGAKADACAIWIVQYIGREIRFLNYYEAQGQPLAAHVTWLRDNGYAGAMCVLPHDGATNDRVHDVSYESALRAAGFEVQVIANQGTGAAMKRVEALRRLFPSCWFNEPKTSAGIDALGWYHEKRDEERGIGLGPDHDWSSHCADAAGLVAVAYEQPQGKSQEPKFIRRKIA
ncbi:MAG: phage terminase large subunit [Cypionkella sp.]